MTKDFNEFVDAFYSESEEEWKKQLVSDAIHAVADENGRIDSASLAGAAMIISNKQSLRMLKMYHEWINS